MNSTTHIMLPTISKTFLNIQTATFVGKENYRNASIIKVKVEVRSATIAPEGS